MISASSRTRNCVAMKYNHNVYIMANAQTCVYTVATVWLSRYYVDMYPFSSCCVDMCPLSSYCVDRFCWFLAVPLIHHIYMYCLTYQLLSQVNNPLIHNHFVWPLAATLQFICDFNIRYVVIIV